MRPNLKSSDIIKLQFSATVTLSASLIGEIRKASPPDEDGDSVFVDSYRSDGINHRAWAWVSGVEEGTMRASIQFNYELGKGGKLRKAAPRVNQLVDIVSSIEEGVEADCEATFEFGRLQKAKPIVPLPMRLIELPGMPFDEIEGLHLVKRDGEQSKYDVILDIPRKGVLRESVFFSYHARIQETLADEILREAAKISNRFVVKEG